MDGLTKQEKLDLLADLLRGELTADRVRLSEAQLRLWELEAHAAPQGIHSFALAYFLRGVIQAGLLEKALQAVAARHDALRARIALIEGEPFFELASAGDVKLELKDCPEHPSEEVLKLEAARPLKLTAEPAWRCVLFKRAEEEHILLLQFHHIVADRWSAAIFVTELGAAYSALLEGRPLPPPESASPHFAGPDPAILAGDTEVVAAQMAYWQRMLSAAHTLELPSIHGGGFGGYAGARIETELDASLVAALKGFAASQSTTLFPVLLAAFAVLLRAHTGQEDLLICTPMTGRHRAGTRGVIGYFNNIIPLRLDVSGDPSFTSLVGKVAARALEAYAHQDVPLSLITELPELAGVRLTRCLFALQNIPGLDLHLPGVVASYRDIPNGSANFDLSLFLEEKEGRLRVLLDYKTAVIREADAQKLKDRLIECLQCVTAQPGARLSHFPRYAQEEHSARASASAPAGERKQKKAPAAPTLLEHKMILLWRELFRESSDTIHGDSHFFELGGDSMRAARLFGRIEAEFGQQLPLATLFEAPTPRQLVERMSDKDWVAPWTSLIPLRPTGSRPPLFCVAGGGGNVLSFRHLAECLPKEQPVYCLQAKGLRRGEQALTTVEESAEHYLDAVRRLAPEGPYLLTGHSFGALVAYEMAQRLVQQGKQVALLALLDYPGPDIRLTRIDWIRYHLISLSMQTPREGLHYIWRGIRWKFRTRLVARRIQKSQDAPSSGEAGWRWSSVDVLEKSMRAIRNYQIKPYDGRIALFRGRHSDPKMVIDPQGGWGRVALRGVDVYEVPGGHMSIFKDPYVRELGAALARCLERTYEKTDARAAP